MINQPSTIQYVPTTISHQVTIGESWSPSPPSTGIIRHHHRWLKKLHHFQLQKWFRTSHRKSPWLVGQFPGFPSDVEIFSGKNTSIRDTQAMHGEAGVSENPVGNPYDWWVHYQAQPSRGTFLRKTNPNPWRTPLGDARAPVSWCLPTSSAPLFAGHPSHSSSASGARPKPDEVQELWLMVN